MQGYNIKDIEELNTGGKTKEELLTGEYLKGISPSSGMQPNAEVEGGEYIQFPEGDTQKVVGPDHEQGGVPVNIPDQTRVLSKSLFLTKDQAEKFSELFSLELSTKDSYAKALDKLTRKIGLQKLNEEQEELFKLVRKELDKPNLDPKTKRVNQDYLSKKIYNLEQTKKPLEDTRSKFFDILFETQEKTKADQGDEEAKFRYGGIQRANFEATARKLGLDPEQAAMMLKQKRAIQVFNDGGIFVSDPKTIKTFGNLPEDMQTKVIQYYQKHAPKLAKAMQNNPDRWKSFVINQGIVTALESGTDIKVFDQRTDKQPTRIKSGTFGNVSADLVDYYTLKDYYERKSGKSFENISSAELKNLQEEFNRDFKNRTGIDYASGPMSGKRVVSDGRYGNITAGHLRENVTLKADKSGVIDVDKLIGLSDEEINKQLAGTGLTVDNIKDYKNSAVKYITLNPEAPVVPTNTDTGGQVTPPNEKDPELKGTEIIDRVGQVPAKTYPRLFFTPDQSALPPTAPEAHLKVNTRLERIDPVRIGIEQTLQETANQRNFVADQVSSLPESQRVAVLANLLATTQGTINQAATQANITNAQNQSQAELFNIQQAGQEEMANAQNALDFEQRQFTAKAKADEALRGYYDYNRKVNVTNFQNMQKLNLLDSLFPDYDLDFFGASVNYNPKSEWAPVVGNVAQQNSTQKTEEELKNEYLEARTRDAQERARRNRILNEKEALTGFTLSSLFR